MFSHVKTHVLPIPDVEKLPIRDVVSSWSRHCQRTPRWAVLAGSAAGSARWCCCWSQTQSPGTASPRSEISPKINQWPLAMAGLEKIKYPDFITKKYQEIKSFFKRWIPPCRDAILAVSVFPAPLSPEMMKAWFLCSRTWTHPTIRMGSFGQGKKWLPLATRIFPRH